MMDRHSLRLTARLSQRARFGSPLETCPKRSVNVNMMGREAHNKLKRNKQALVPPGLHNNMVLMKNRR